MNDNMQQLAIIAAIAIYKVRGITFALTYLMQYGMTLNEAIDIFAEYDRAEDQVKAGLL